MKNYLMILSFSAVTAFAGTNQECVRVDDGDDWVVLLSDHEQRGNFWDNDHDTALLLTETLSLESNPPQIQNTYEGLDGEILVKVVHNKTMGTAVLYDAVGTEEESSYELECYDVDSDGEG